MLISNSPGIMVAWLLWCIAHSLVASRRVKGGLARWLRLPSRHYRLSYVLFSSLTISILIVWQMAVVSLPLPAGYPWQLVRLLLFAYSIYMFYAGSQAYDLSEFLGINGPDAVT